MAPAPGPQRGLSGAAGRSGGHRHRSGSDFLDQQKKVHWIVAGAKFTPLEFRALSPQRGGESQKIDSRMGLATASPGPYMFTKL